MDSNCDRSFVGIDPGCSGAIAVIHPVKLGLEPERAFFRKMPRTEENVWDTIRYVCSTPVRVVIEMVSGYIGGEGHPGSAMFNFGASYGGLRMALVACGLREGLDWEAVSPQTWQKQLDVERRSRNEPKSAWKRRLRSKAQDMFPGLYVSLATADALLIADYCRRKYAT